MDALIAPHGGRLVDPMLPSAERAAARARAAALPALDLGPRALCDLELLLSGAFSPLQGFMGRADHARVCTELRLAEGTLWPMPVTLYVAPESSQSRSASADAAPQRDAAQVPGRPVLPSIPAAAGGDRCSQR